MLCEEIRNGGDSLYVVTANRYGNMGEVTKETRIYALPFLSQPLALSTQFEYDSWGRILNLNSTNKCKLSQIEILSSKGKQILSLHLKGKMTIFVCDKSSKI